MIPYLSTHDMVAIIFVGLCLYFAIPILVRPIAVVFSWVVSIPLEFLFRLMSSPPAPPPSAERSCVGGRRMPATPA